MPEVGIEHFKDVSPSNPNPHAATSVPVIFDHGQEEQSDYEEGIVEEYPNEVDFIPSIPLALRNVDFNHCSTRTDFMRQIIRNIPVNEYNLPQFLYRADLITPPVVAEDPKDTDYKTIAEMLEAAQITLSYEQGFPALANGQPIWGQFDYEDKESFTAFLQYLDQPGARRLDKVNCSSPDLVMNWYAQNFWPTRALAYDMFKIAHYQRLREHRILALNDTHFIEAEKAFGKLAKVLGDKLDDVEAMKELSVPETVSALDKIVKIQRLAAGLSTTGGKDEPSKTTTSVEVSMREVSQTSQPIRERDDDADITELLANPDLLNKAQELIIKVNR